MSHVTACSGPDPRYSFYFGGRIPQERLPTTFNPAGHHKLITHKGMSEMDFITTGVIASTVYDVLKHGLKLSAGVLKDRLGQWLREDVAAEAVVAELSKLDLHDGLSEKAISQQIDQSPTISTLIREINAKAALVAPSTISNVTQTHSGSGDNVGGNKIVN